jgi:hypothetical protein
MLKSPVKLNERKIYISASIGIASGSRILFEHRAVSPGRYCDVSLEKIGKGRTSWYDEPSTIPGSIS